MKKTGRLPKFHESVQRRAAQLLESYLEVIHDDDSGDLDLSDSFFEMDSETDEPQELVTVHAIGKPEGVDLNRRGSQNVKSTYHMLQWQVGKDISADEYHANQDASGELFIWYRWMGDSWTWKCVTREEFEQLKSVGG